MVTKEDLQKENDDLEKKINLLELDRKFIDFEKKITLIFEEKLTESRHKLREYLHVEINNQIEETVKSSIKQMRKDLNNKMISHQKTTFIQFLKDILKYIFK